MSARDGHQRSRREDAGTRERAAALPGAEREDEVRVVARVENRGETAVQESVQRPHAGFRARTVTASPAEVDVGVHEPGNEVFPGAVDARYRPIHREGLGGNRNDAVAVDQHGRAGDGRPPGTVDEGDSLDEERGLLGRSGANPEHDGEGGEQDAAQEHQGRSFLLPWRAWLEGSWEPAGLESLNTGRGYRQAEEALTLAPSLFAPRDIAFRS